MPPMPPKDMHACTGPCFDYVEMLKKRIDSLQVQNSFAERRMEEIFKERTLAMQMAMQQMENELRCVMMELEDYLLETLFCIFLKDFRQTREILRNWPWLGTIIPDNLSWLRQTEWLGVGPRQSCLARSRLVLICFINLEKFVWSAKMTCAGSILPCQCPPTTFGQDICFFFANGCLTSCDDWSCIEYLVNIYNIYFTFLCFGRTCKIFC